MNLPHNAHTTSLSPDQAIKEVLKNPGVEVDLAVSHHFWDFDGEMDAVLPAYEAYFEKTVAGLTKLLGKPVFSGDYSTDLSEWTPMVPEHATAEQLAVWERDKHRLYCRYSHEDNEIPILIALGVEGCEASNADYGEFEE